MPRKNLENEPLSCWALDPGSEKSAVVVYNGRVLDYFIMANEPLVRRFTQTPVNHNVLVIEQVVNYGKTVGQTVFDTVFWSGRFAQAWQGPFVMRPRRVVKKYLRAKNDSGVRAALIERFGEPPGLTADMWQALGLAVTYWEVYRFQPPKRGLTTRPGSGRIV